MRGTLPLLAGIDRWWTALKPPLACRLSELASCSQEGLLQQPCRWAALSSFSFCVFHSHRLLRNSLLQAAMASSEPDWASLRPELWHSILCHLGACRPGQLAQAVQWWRQLVTFSVVCHATRDAVLGAGAGPLWRTVILKSSHRGMGNEPSRQLNRLLASQGHHARAATVYGGNWDLDALHTTAASLTGLHTLSLLNVNDALEAWTLSSVLPGCAVTDLVYKGAPLLALPASLRSLELLDTFTHTPRSQDELQEAVTHQKHSQQLLRCLKPLSQLTTLSLSSFVWRLSHKDVDAIMSWCPQLEALKLDLAVNTPLGVHALGALSRVPSSVQLQLSLLAQDSSLTGLLQALRSVQLGRLTIDEGQSYRLSAADEGHLAHCRVADQLTLKLHAREPAVRLRRLLAGVTRVAYEPSA